MTKPIININVLRILKFAFVFLIASWLGVSKAGQLDYHKNVSMLIPDPDVLLQETYLKGNRKEKKRQCSKEVASALGAKCSYCHNDEVTTFTEKGERAREDMEAAIAIGVKCDYCHAGREQFTDKKEIAVKMFELSEITGAACNFCHAGKEVLTHEGKTAKTAMILQEWAENGSKKCMECHVEKKQFELNFHGWEVLNTQKGLLGL
jgi:nitrate/TMAO reductase-like tetraheme cytochrome c subunit